MSYLSFFLFSLFFISSNNFLLTMGNTSRDHSLNSSYSTKNLFNMMQEFNIQRENLNADIAANNDPDMKVMQARCKKHAQRSRELEFQFNVLENIIAIHGNIPELEQAYEQHKKNTQFEKEQIDVKELNKTCISTDTSDSLKAPIVHSVSFSNQSITPSIESHTSTSSISTSKKKYNQRYKINTQFFPQIFGKLIAQQIITKEQFNELSNCRKTTLLLNEYKASVDDALSADEQMHIETLIKKRKISQDADNAKYRESTKRARNLNTK